MFRLKVRSVSTDEPCLTVPCQNERCPYECPVCLLRACINCPWEQRLWISSSSPVFVSARVIDADGVRIRADQELTVDWCELLYGKIPEWCLRFMHSCSRKGFGMLTFVLLKSTRVLIIDSLIDLLLSHACHLTYTVLQRNDVRLFQESIKKSKTSSCLFWFTFLFTGHFLYLRADSNQTSGMAKAYSTSLPARIATEDYQVYRSVLAPLWSWSSDCRHCLNN